METKAQKKKRDKGQKETIEEFLARGGKIRKFPPSASAGKAYNYNNKGGE